MYVENYQTESEEVRDMNFVDFRYQNWQDYWIHEFLTIVEMSHW